jgi:serine/threonine protein kinase
LKNEILKRISLNISPAPAAHDFLPLKNLKYNENPKISKIDEGNFYTLYENELLNGSKVLLKFPVSNENSRVEREYQLTLECQNSGFLVTPIRLLKFGHKIGIVCEDLRGQLLQDQFMSMTTDQKVKIMKDIAECLQSIHSKGIYHLNITPKTIAISNKTKGKLLNMKYATKSSRITHFSYSSLMYTDPELLISRSAGFFTDVWSWAVTFISLFTELNPYSGVLTPELFQFQKKTTSFNILELSEQIHSEIIKNKKRPLIESLPLPEELISLLITCLSIPAENRPTMAEIVKKLRISSI